MFRRTAARLATGRVRAKPTAYAGGGMNPRRPVQPWISAALLAVGAIAGSGCMTGDRPTLAEATSTGHQSIDQLLERIGDLGEARYSAHYDVLVRYGDVATTAIASQSDGDRRSLTIGDVRYVSHAQITKTCTVSTATCIPEIDPTRVSDVMMTPDFFGTSMIARIELDASRAIAEPVVTVEQTDGGEATCVAIPITDATTTYCALENGVLTRMDGPDLVVTMSSYSDEVDELLYAEGDLASTTEPAIAASATDVPESAAGG